MLQVFSAPFEWLESVHWMNSSAIGNPKEKIRIEPLEVPVPAKTPAPVETPSEKEPVGA